MLDKIQIVLCNTSHNGNIGAAARAMKTMGITRLTLVNPLVKPDDHAIALSCNAADVVKNVRIVTDLDTALANSTLAIGMSSRKREFTAHLATPREMVPQIIEQIQQGYDIAIVFGSEKNGLSIKELEKCNRLVTIPGNPDYFSLNLAQAVQIMCYEIYSQYNSSLQHLKQVTVPSTIADRDGILNHLEQLLELTGYNRKNAERTRRRLQYILNKADLERTDIDLLRGILKSIEARLTH